MIVGFAASPVACQHIDSFPPDYVYPVALQDGLRSITPYAPGVGASDQRFLLLLLSALTRRPRIAYGSSNIHDANDPASACGIDGLPKFLVFPLATSTRTSLASFEPLLPRLPAVVCHSSSSSSTTRLVPRVRRELSHSGSRSVVRWIC